MKAIKSVCLMFMILIAITGCATAEYGKIHKQTVAENEIKVTDLGDNWQDYDIYYATSNGSRPAAVMFDPKNDDRKLVGDSWRQIDDPVTLAKSIRTIQVWYRYAIVGVIQSPDARVFGYMYYPPQLNIPVKLLDEQTLYVSTLPLPKSGP